MIFYAYVSLMLLCKVNGFSQSSSFVENGKPILRSQWGDHDYPNSWVVDLESAIQDWYHVKGYEDAQPYIAKLIKDAENAHKVKIKIDGGGLISVRILSELEDPDKTRRTFKLRSLSKDSPRVEDRHNLTTGDVIGGVLLVIDSIKGETDYDREKTKQRRKRKHRHHDEDDDDDEFKCPWSIRAGPLAALCGAARTERHLVAPLRSYMTSSEEVELRTRRDEDTQVEKNQPAWVHEVEVYGKYLWEKYVLNRGYSDKPPVTVFEEHFQSVIDDYETKYDVVITHWDYDSPKFTVKYKPRGYNPYQTNEDPATKWSNRPSLVPHRRQRRKQPAWRRFIVIIQT